MFDELSRYAGAETYETTDRRGRRIRAVYAPLPLLETPVGRHVMREGERLDLLASRYLNDPTSFWRISDINGALLPDALSQREQLLIPAAGRVRRS